VWPVEANNAIYFEMELDSVINQIISRFTCDGGSLDLVTSAAPFQFLPYAHLLLIWGTVVPNFSPTDSSYM